MKSTKNYDTVLKGIEEPMGVLSLMLQRKIEERMDPSFNTAFDALCEHMELVGSPNFDYLSDMANAIAAEYVLADIRHMVLQIDSETSKLDDLIKNVLDIILKHHKDVAELLDSYKEPLLEAVKINLVERGKDVESDFFTAFYKNVFPKESNKHGVVYTPVEAVDYMIYAANEILEIEFGTDLNDTNVHLEDPFAGANIYIKRLLEGGRLTREAIIDKFNNGKISYNEIGVSAYLNSRKVIEGAYQKATGEPYTEFKYGYLRDTFLENSNER